MAQIEQKKWYVMNATYGNAMNAQAMLSSLDVRCYVPMEYKEVRRGARSTEQLRPIMQNLIFVKATYSQLREISTGHRYLHFQYTRTGGESRNLPIVVGDEEMEQFISFVDGRFSEVEYIDATQFDLRRGERVLIIDGIFKGKEGTLVSVSGRRYKQIVVAIDGVLAIQIKTPKPWMIVKKL